MAKNVPVLLLRLVERWFSLASTCVKWGGHITHFFKVFANVRQGVALSLCYLQYTWTTLLRKHTILV